MTTYTATFSNGETATRTTDRNYKYATARFYKNGGGMYSNVSFSSKPQSTKMTAADGGAMRHHTYKYKKECQKWAEERFYKECVAI